MDSEAIKAVQAEQAREVEDARSELIDDLAELVCHTLARGAEPEQIRADVEACLSIQLPEPDTRPELCPVCDWPKHAAGQACPGLTADQMREAVGMVLGQADEFWTKHDSASILVERTGEWCSPGTFGSTYGTVKRAQPVGVSDGFAIVVVHGDAGEANTEFVVRLSE